MIVIFIMLLIFSRVPAMEGRLFSQQIPQAVLTHTRKWTFCLVNYPVNFFSIQMKTLSIQPAVKICISISQNYTVKKSWCYILIPAVAWKISVVNYSIHLLILCITVFIMQLSTENMTNKNTTYLKSLSIAKSNQSLSLLMIRTNNG